MLAVSLIAGAVAGISKIVGAVKARQAARRNYNREQTQLKEQFDAGSDQVKTFRDQGDTFLSQGKVNQATSNVGGTTLDLLRDTSESNIQKDASRLEEQNLTGYNRGMEQAQLNKEGAVDDSKGAILGAVGGMALSAASAYGQGVSTGRFQPGVNEKGNWSMGLSLKGRKMSVPQQTQNRNLNYNPGMYN